MPKAIKSKGSVVVEQAPSPAKIDSAALPVLIVVTSPKGGAGKGTVSQAVAVSAAMEGLRVGMLDYDPQGSTTKWAKRRATIEGIAPIAVKAGSWDGVKADLKAAMAEYDVVLVDTPTSVEEHIEEIDLLLRKASYILVPTGPQWTDRESTVPWMTTIRGRTGKAAFVLNRVNRQTRTLKAAKIHLMSTGKLVPLEIPLYEDIGTNPEFGLSAVDVAGARGQAELGSVWSFLKSELGL
jgi:chromosome partitioning protein